jgi:tRNA threonylcarbamoyladenosine biosynthesis protein TsaE
MRASVRTADPAQSVAVGQAISRHLRPGDVVLLHGDLGSGKTTLAHGILSGLGIEGPTPSPTFTLVNEYDGQTADGHPVRVFHLDLYRLHDDDDADLASIGLEDYLAPRDGISLIEWPERAASMLDGVYLVIEITPAGENERQLRLTPLPADSPRFPWLDDFAQGQWDPNSR